MGREETEEAMAPLFELGVDRDFARGNMRLFSAFSRAKAPLLPGSSRQEARRGERGGRLQHRWPASG